MVQMSNALHVLTIMLGYIWHCLSFSGFLRPQTGEHQSPTCLKTEVFCRERAKESHPTRIANLMSRLRALL